MDPMDTQRSPRDPRPPKSRPGSSASSTFGDAEPARETFVYLSFKTKKDRDEWFTILRALAKVNLEDGRLARPHRRLKVGVLDLAETTMTNLQPWTRRYGDGSGTQPDDALSTGSISSEGIRNGSAKMALSPKMHKSSDLEVQSRVATRPGWSWRERIRVEL
jgi:hypothetical protein